MVKNSAVPFNLTSSLKNLKDVNTGDIGTMFGINFVSFYGMYALPKQALSSPFTITLRYINLPNKVEHYYSQRN